MISLKRTGIIGSFLHKCLIEPIQLHRGQTYTICQVHRRFFGSLFLHFMSWFGIVLMMVSIIVAPITWFVPELSSNYPGNLFHLMWLLGTVAWGAAIVFLGVALITVGIDTFKDYRQARSSILIADRNAHPEDHPLYMWYKAFHDKVCPFVEFK